MFSILGAVICAKARVAGGAIVFALIGLVLFVSTPAGSGLPRAVSGFVSTVDGAATPALTGTHARPRSLIPAIGSLSDERDDVDRREAAGAVGRSSRGSIGAARSVAEQLAAVEPLVRGICRSRLGPVDGDDAAQRTLLVLWRKLADGGRPVESLPAYATVCARYETLPHAAGHRGRSAVPLGEAVERTVADDAPGSAERARREADDGAAEARVEQLLAALTPRQAEVLRATKLEGCDTDSGRRGSWASPPSSVRTVQARAMARLRELCGTRSPNPLASAMPEAQRRQAAWAERGAARRAEGVAHPSPRGRVRRRVPAATARRRAVAVPVGGRPGLRRVLRVQGRAGQDVALARVRPSRRRGAGHRRGVPGPPRLPQHRHGRG